VIVTILDGEVGLGNFAGLGVWFFRKRGPCAPHPHTHHSQPRRLRSWCFLYAPCPHHQQRERNCLLWQAGSISHFSCTYGILPVRPLVGELWSTPSDHLPAAGQSELRAVHRTGCSCVPFISNPRPVWDGEDVLGKSRCANRPVQQPLSAQPGPWYAVLDLDLVLAPASHRGATPVQSSSFALCAAVHVGRKIEASPLLPVLPRDMCRSHSASQKLPPGAPKTSPGPVAMAAA